MTHFLPGPLSASGDAWCGAALSAGDHETENGARVTCPECRVLYAERFSTARAALRGAQ